MKTLERQLRHSNAERWNDAITAFIASLERHGVNNETIKEALLEIVHH
jgi:DNA-binding transcriptional regulator YhcF (GntR family)